MREEDDGETSSCGGCGDAELEIRGAVMVVAEENRAKGQDGGGLCRERDGGGCTNEAVLSEMHGDGLGF